MHTYALILYRAGPLTYIRYAHGKLAISNFAASASAIAALLERYRSAGGDVIHVLHDTPEGAPLFTPGTNLAEPYPTVVPKAGESVVHKIHPICFTGECTSFAWVAERMLMVTLQKQTSRS